MNETVVRRLITADGRIKLLDQMSMKRIRMLLNAQGLDTVNLGNGMVMLVDDDGHARELQPNALATALYHKRCKPGTEHTIVGDVVIVPDADFGVTP